MTNTPDAAPQNTHPENPAPLTPAVVAALGDGPDLTNEDVALLHVLLSHENDPWKVGRDNVETLTEADALEEFENFSGLDTSEDRQVADRLREHHNRIDGYGAFEFEHLCDSDGVPSSYSVLTRVPAGDGLWLSSAEDIKYLAAHRYSLRGLRAALHIASVIEGDWKRLRRSATELGLLEPAASRPSVWPETDEEREAFADWQYEVANGDAPNGFRDWYAARAAADLDEPDEVDEASEQGTQPDAEDEA